MLLALLLSCHLKVPDPAAYHWRGQRRFYEGWYLRVTDAEQGESFGLIYGIAHHPGSDGGGEGYLIVLSAKDAAAAWTRVPLAEVQAEPGVYDLAIGSTPERFGRLDATGGAGAFVEGPLAVSWDIELAPEQGWERPGLDSPMGWVLRTSSFQTYWHVEHLRARASGKVVFGGREIVFDDALGYVEKNWGRVFPRDWMWLQAGTFVARDPDGQLLDGERALSASGGHVPLFLGLGPRAGIVGWFDGEAHHHWATHTGQRVRMEAEAGHWQVRARGHGEQLLVEAAVDPHLLVPIVGPTPDGVQDVAIESLAGVLTVELYTRKRPFGRWRLQQAATSDLAGVEVGGLQAVQAATPPD